LDVILGDDIEDEFDVTAESVPSGLPDTYEGRHITWVSNFKVQKKPGKAKTGKQVNYTIELTSISGQLVYHDEASNDVLPLTTRPAGTNRIQADLSVEDPPVGFG
jgi:hypothetical protein